MQQEIYPGFGRHLWSTNLVSIATALLRCVKVAVFGRRELQHGVAVMEAAAVIDILVVDETQMAPVIDILSSSMKPKSAFSPFAETSSPNTH
jgi:hypothetical protein